MRLWDIIFPCMSSENLRVPHKKFHRNLSRRIPSNLSVFTLICAICTFDSKLYGIQSVRSKSKQCFCIYSARCTHKYSHWSAQELRNRSILEYSYMRIILIWSSITHFQSNVKGFFVFFLTICTK